jgi:hypothetical protein
MRPLRELLTKWELKMLYSRGLRYEEAKRRFPKGHPFIEECLQTQEDEYARSDKQEEEFGRWWRQTSFIHSHEDAKDICNGLCREMKCDPIKEVRAREEEWKYGGSYYRPKKSTIYINQPIRLYVLVHELSHHIHSFRLSYILPFARQHGEEFCKIEQGLFTLLLQHQWDYPSCFAWLRKGAKDASRSQDSAVSG